ncbi:uncharacterized protein [Manis javanica]|uniref:uncharacterized protein n=1 Tax=Manis javanica TaxID=9974 RepID=UPI003C6D60BD
MVVARPETRAGDARSWSGSVAENGNSDLRERPTRASSPTPVCGRWTTRGGGCRCPAKLSVSICFIRCHQVSETSRARRCTDTHTCSLAGRGAQACTRGRRERPRPLPAAVRAPQAGCADRGRSNGWCAFPARRGRERRPGSERVSEGRARARGRKGLGESSAEAAGTSPSHLQAFAPAAVPAYRPFPPPSTFLWRDLQCDPLRVQGPLLCKTLNPLPSSAASSRLARPPRGGVDSRLPPAKRFLCDGSLTPQQPQLLSNRPSLKPEAVPRALQLERRAAR